MASVLWLTPAMDRLFTGSAGDRRRFLDRFVLALEPSHAHHSSRYEAAMRGGTNSWPTTVGDRPGWRARAADGRAWHGDRKGAARTVERSMNGWSSAPDDEFARASIAIEGWAAGDLVATLRINRRATPAPGAPPKVLTGRTLLVTHRAKQMPAARSSTGEQKALLLGLVLAHADLVAERRGEPPILLLDEVAAHLDPKRRTALFTRLEGRGQVWMTATEAALFDGIADGVALPRRGRAVADPA